MSLTLGDFPLVAGKLLLRGANEVDITYEAVLPFIRAQRLADLEAFARLLRVRRARWSQSELLAVAVELDAVVKELRA